MEKKFSKYAKHGAYHFRWWYANKPSYTNHVNRVKDWIKEKNVLDVGCGDGLISFVVGMRGVDNEPDAIKAGKLRNAPIELGDAYNLNFKDEEFDAVFMGDTLEHFEFPEKALVEARRVLKQYLYIVVPRKERRMEEFQYHDWTPEQLKEEVERVGFVLEGDIELDNKKNYAKFRKV
jgi:ubiquinone/menaquinone biosynthesis C-methylase UbiE